MKTFIGKNAKYPVACRGNERETGSKGVPQLAGESFISILMLVLFLGLMGPVAGSAQTGPVSETITTDDLKLPEATPEYLEAYQLFLKATSSDTGEFTYANAIVSLREAEQNAPAQSIKLRCQFLIAFALVLEGNIPEAYQAGLETVASARAGLKNDPVMAALDRIKIAVEGNSITNISRLNVRLNLGKEAGQLTEDLFYLQQGWDKYRQGLEALRQKIKMNFEQKISDNARLQGLTQQEIDKIKPILENNYTLKESVDPFGLASDIEDEHAKLLLEELVK